jgi:nucleotide-binding universal stress UspA family protein
MGHIVVGIDAGRASDSALDWAIGRIGTQRVELRLVTATERSSERELSRLRGLRGRVLAARPRAQVETIVRPQSIVDALGSESEGADVLVVGSGSRHPFLSALAGSIPVRVAASSDVPVVVVPLDWTEGGGDVVTCLGDDGNADDAAFYAAREAERLGARLVVLHAWSYPRYDDPAGHFDVPKAEVRAVHAADVALVADALAEQFPALEIVRVLDEDDAASAITQHAASARLVVMGTHGFGPVLGALLGSVGAEVLRTSACPVCIVPGETARVPALIGAIDEG